MSEAQTAGMGGAGGGSPKSVCAVLLLSLFDWSHGEAMLSTGSQATSFEYLDHNCPATSPVQSTAGADDYEFCNMLFRKFPSVEKLHNWQNFTVKSDDIFFATLPPSGGAKSPGLKMIADLTGAQQISGHTEFDPGWESSNLPPKLNISKRRLIGTHLPFEFLPTQVLETPAGQEPCSVVFLVRAPKENMVGAATGEHGGGTVADTVNQHVTAASSAAGGVGEKGVPNRGFKAFSNGYAAAVEGKQTASGRGPKVLLLSQARMASADDALAEVQKLSTFFGLKGTYSDSTRVASLVNSVQCQLGDVTQLTEDQKTSIDNAFSKPAIDPRVVDLYACASGTCAAGTCSSAGDSQSGATSGGRGGDNSGDKASSGGRSGGNTGQQSGDWTGGMGGNTGQQSGAWNRTSTPVVELDGSAANAAANTTTATATAATADALRGQGSLAVPFLLTSVAVFLDLFLFA